MTQEPIQSLTFMTEGFACNYCLKRGLKKAFTVLKYCLALIFLNFSDFELMIICKLLLYSRENVLIFVDVFQYFKTKQDLIFCIFLIAY